MPELVKTLAEWSSATMETLGVFLIVGVALYALLSGAIRLLNQDQGDAVFQQLRQRLGRAILLGLEFLVAADIIFTVAVDATFRTVGVLVIIVLVRTFLSFTLEVELTGRWPWQNEG